MKSALNWSAYLLVFLLSPFASAQDAEPHSSSTSSSKSSSTSSIPSTEAPPIVDPQVVTPDVKDEPTVDVRPQRRNDHPFAFIGQASFIGLAVPTKYGLGFTYRVSPHWALEPSFFNGSYGISSHWIDIGSFNESLWMLNARLYVSPHILPSCSFIFGLTRQNYVAHIGNSILSNAGVFQQGADLINVTTMGLQFGVGNRWVYRRLVFGVDWLTLNIPFRTLENDVPALGLIDNSSVLSDIDGAIKIMRYLPTGSLLKFALGFSF